MSQQITTHDQVDVIAALSEGWKTHGRLIPAHPSFIVVIACSAALAIGCAVTGIRIGMWDIIGPALLALLGMVLMSIFLAGLNLRRLAALVETMAFISLLAMIVPLLSCVLATSSLPLSDRFCLWLDAQMGLSWLDIAFWFRAHPRLMLVLSHAYASLGWQTVPLMLALALANPQTLRPLASAWAVSLAATIAIFPFMPSLGGYLHFGLPHSQFPDVLPEAAWGFMAAMGPARDGSLHVLTQVSLEGIINFPSFHSAAAVIFIWAWWQIPYLRWPGTVLNTLMLVSTIPCGGHYVVDVIAGCVIAIASIEFSAWYFATVLPQTTALSMDPLEGAIQVCLNWCKAGPQPRKNQPHTA